MKALVAALWRLADELDAEASASYVAAAGRIRETLQAHPSATEPHIEKTEECDSCGWETDALTEVYLTGMMQTGLLCEVCRSTKAGNAFLNPGPYCGDANVLTTIAWGINYLASKIDGGKD